MADPARRVFINSDVCEGCGDCSVQSNCVSIEPLETPLGRKRQINQSSCNKDFSCLKGFCPSFVTIEGGGLKKSVAMTSTLQRRKLPVPTVPVLSDEPWNIAVTGVGGTGVLTIGALLGMAAHIDRGACMVLDMAGLAQKGGAVLSHVRLATRPEHVASPHIVSGSADLVIAADAVVAASREGQVLCDARRTRAIVNTSTAPVAGFVRERDFDFKYSAVECAIAEKVQDSRHFLPFSEYAQRQTGDSISTNVMMLGYAWQQGLVPLSFDALEQAIKLNGVAVELNLAAFYLGRALCVDPQSVSKSVSTDRVVAMPARATDLSQILTHRAKHLRNYQSAALADRYTARVRSFAESCKQAGLGDALAILVAENHARLLSYKDEYEVARLYSLPEFQDRLARTFEGDFRIKLHLAPPFMNRSGADGRPAKRAFGPWILKLFGFLQHGKRLRGSMFDIFGYSAERQREREWIGCYERDIKRLEALLGALDTEQKREYAAQILALPDAIRGFGVVKHEAMVKAAFERARLWEKLESEMKRPQKAAA